MKSFGITDKGKVRKDNQDNFCIENWGNSLIFALCDGMGGAKAGGIASELSIRTFTNCIISNLPDSDDIPAFIDTLLSEACRVANSLAYEYSSVNAMYNGMGTTLVGGVLFPDGSVRLVNVGDSRAYHISLNNSDIYQITSDHSLVQELITSGAITYEEAKKHPQRNVITRAIGTDPFVEADYFELKLEANDILLLCSDGLSNIVSDMEMLEYSTNYPDPDMLCTALISKALNRGASDNVTVLAISNI